MSYVSFPLEPRLQIKEVYTIFQRTLENHYDPGSYNDFTELFFVTDGVFDCYLNDTYHSVTSGHLMLVAPHTWFPSAKPNNASVQIVSFRCDCEELKQISNQVIRLSMVQQENLKQIINLGMHLFSFSRSFGNVSLSATKEQSIFDVQKFKYMLELFLIELYESKNYKSNSDDALFEDIVTFFKLNINKKLSLDEIAQNFHISVSKLQRLFVKQAGTSVKSFFMQLKLDYSKELLYRTYNCTQVAIDLAFSSVHYFSSSFKARFGISPSQYLKSLREDDAK